MELAWDPEIDTPATIAVIGGGPVGVEAALYARFLGYSVLLFDSYKVGHRQLAWGHYLMHEPWSVVTSPLGLAALRAQGAVGDLPESDTQVSYREYVEKYLLPVARTDLLYDSVQINSPVISISRTGCDDPSTPARQRRAEQEFRVLVDSKQRGEYTQLVDIILDCSGLAPRRGLASGGGLAIGESAQRAHASVGKMDVLRKHRERFAGKHVLLYGRDWNAAANALDLAQLASESAETRTTWIVPKRIGATSALELPATCDVGLQAAAQELLSNNHPGVVSLPAWGIESLQLSEARWQVRLQTSDEDTLDIAGDVFISCPPRLAEWSFCDRLLLPGEPQLEVLSPEPHYYVLGEKLWGESAGLATAWPQIRQAFALIGGRADLDLYATIAKQNAG